MGSVSDVGEFALVARLIARLPAGRGVRIGPGDDAAVLDPPPRALIAAADVLVEGTHFDLRFSEPADVGFKAIAVNASDVAAMGGLPRYALIAIGIPPAQTPDVAEAIYDGIADASEQFGVAIVGGDTVSSIQFVVSVSILGEEGEHGIVCRDGARSGDALCVTGMLGSAAAGLLLFRTGTPEARGLLDRFPDLASSHRRGRARISEGQAAAAHGARAMIDISDGLVADVEHICAASGVRARIDGRALPLAPGVAETDVFLNRVGEVSVLGATGGDDYELAIAIPPERVPGLARAIEPTPLTRIGSFEDGAGVVVDGLEPGARAGWDHFRQ